MLLKSLHLKALHGRERLFHVRDALEGRVARLFLDEPGHRPTVQETTQVILEGRGLDVELSDAQLVTWEEDGGLLMHPGSFRKDRSKDIRAIVVHWGGLDPHHCQRVLAQRGYSSHFGVGRACAYQWLDMGDTAHHCKEANAWSVGIDICQSPQVSFLSKTRARGYEVTVGDNPTDRGADRVVTLDADVARNTRALVLALCKALDIPLVAPPSHKTLTAAQLRKFSGVLGHHHTNPQKWDVACWWSNIFQGTPLDVMG